MASLPSSKYQQIATQLLRRIESGELTGALPGVKQLALEYDVNFMTVDKAIRQLKEMEVVERIPRKGTYVRKQKTVAICANDPNPCFLQMGFYAPFIGAVQNYLGQRNCLLFTENLYGRPELYMRNLCRRIDGVILLSSIFNKVPAALRSVCKVLAMGVVDPQWRSDHITYDNCEVGRLAAEYLLHRNCRSYAYIGSTSSSLCEQRCRSFREHAEESGHPVLLMAARTFPDREEMLTQLEVFRNLENRPDGIFCPTDDDAVFVSNWLWGNGIVPGRDVHIIGCNNESQILNLAIAEAPATIDLRLEEIGKLAAEQLCLRVDGLSDERFVKTFTPKLKEK